MKYFFYSPFLNFSGFWAKSFSDFWPKNVKSLSKLPSTCPEEQFVAWIFFKFWIFSDFLQKPLAWFSKIYLREQSKNCGKNSLFLFSFQNFFRILSENFSDFWPINFKKFSKLSSTCPEEQFVAWNNFFSSSFLNFSGFWAKHFSDFWPKNFKKMWKLPSACPEEQFVAWNNFFSSPFLSFSGFWAKNFSDFWPKNVKNLSKLPSTCPEEQFVAWFFFKFWIVSDFLQKPLARFSKFYLGVQSKNCGKNSLFLYFFSDFFSEFQRKYFRLPGKNLQKVVKTTFCVSRGTICGLNFF